MATLPNMTAIQTVTVGSGGAANITFSNIPQTYTDLFIVYSLRTTQTGTYADGLGIRFNGDSGSNYPYVQLYGTGNSGVGTNSGTVSFIYGRPLNGASSTANTFGNGQVYIPNYTSSNSKSVSVDSVTEGNTTGSDQGFVAQRWTGTSAISSIVMLDYSGNNLAQYSTATLYGVTSAGYGAKATGGIISQDANYFYHTFLASGTFTPTQSITADCLVIAGAGGGGSGNGAGGGAGGLLLHSSQSLTATGYTVTVGAGGSGGTSDAAGNTGSDSQFASLTASKGGGGGGGWLAVTGKNGGSGGGGSGQLSGPNAGGTATSGQGNNGGTGGYYSSQAYGGGGGGAGGVGENASAGNPGDGGIGSATYSSWGSSTFTGQNSSGIYYYAGGGGGGDSAGIYTANGGLGGGGKGGSGGGTAGTAGTANTGGGGGGGGTSAAAGASGGSGIVIVRYAK